MYLLDTNTVIYYFKGKGNIAAHLLETPPEEIGIPAIVQYEIETGINKSNNPEQLRQQFQDFLSAISVAPFDEPAAKASAQIRATLEKRGTPIGPYDTLIAGTTVARNAVLVTHNTQEFGRIEVLSLEDWWH